MLPIEFTTVRLSKLGVKKGQTFRLAIVGNYLIEEISEKIEPRFLIPCTSEETRQRKSRKNEPQDQKLVIIKDFASPTRFPQ